MSVLFLSLSHVLMSPPLPQSLLYFDLLQNSKAHQVLTTGLRYFLDALGMEEVQHALLLLLTLVLELISIQLSANALAEIRKQSMQEVFVQCNPLSHLHGGSNHMWDDAPLSSQERSASSHIGSGSEEEDLIPAERDAMDKLTSAFIEQTEKNVR